MNKASISNASTMIVALRRWEGVDVRAVKSMDLLCRTGIGYTTLKAIRWLTEKGVCTCRDFCPYYGRTRDEGILCSKANTCPWWDSSKMPDPDIPKHPSE